LKRVAKKEWKKARPTKRPTTRAARAERKGKPSTGLIPYKKGQPGLGRQKGVKNKIPVRIKEALLEALELSGSNGKGRNGATGYFVWLSRAEPAVFGRMIEKILPMQLEVRDKTNEKLTPDEAIERLKDRGLPVPESLMSLSTKVGEAIMQRRAENDEEEHDADGLDDLDDEEPAPVEEPEEDDTDE
jgi:hypothetical protein